jgi:glycosyltransferase involved in cell wall biosynthesis
LKYYPNTKPDKIVTTYPGIEIEKSDFVPEIENYYLFVGHARPIKNIEKVLEFYTLELQKDKTLKMIFVGGFEKEYFEKISKSDDFKKNKINIYFFEKVSNKELYGYYKYAKALVNFSYEEGLNFPSLEAKKIGNKIITNDLEIYKEHVDIDKYSWSKFTEQIISYIMN